MDRAWRDQPGATMGDGTASLSRPRLETTKAPGRSSHSGARQQVRKFASRLFRRWGSPTIFLLVAAGTQSASDITISRQMVISETEVPVATEQATINFTLTKFQVDAIASVVQISCLAFGGADGAEGLLQLGKHSCILSLGAAGIIIVPAFISYSCKLKIAISADRTSAYSATRPCATCEAT
jgi:hypothetical protein